MTSTTVPVSFDWLRVDVDLNLENLCQAVHDIPAEPELVGHVDAVARADLDLPLAAHHLCVRTGDGQACLQAGKQHCFGELAAEGVLTAYCALVRTLRLRLPVCRESKWPWMFIFFLQIHDYIFLFNAEPRVFLETCVEYFFCKVS